MGVGPDQLPTWKQAHYRLHWNRPATTPSPKYCSTCEYVWPVFNRMDKLNCNQLVVLAKVWMRLLFLTRQRPSGVKMRIGGSWWVVKGSTGRWLFCIGGRILWSGSRCNILYILQLMQECGSALIFFLSRLWAKTGWILHSHAHVWSMCWRWALTFRDMSTIL